MKRVNDLMRAEYRRADWQDRPVFLTPAAAHAPRPVAGSLRRAWQRAHEPLRGVLAALRRARTRRAAYRQLAALDDHLLRDIGLNRDDLWGVAGQLQEQQGLGAQERAVLVDLAARRRRQPPRPATRERAA